MKIIFIFLFLTSNCFAQIFVPFAFWRKKGLWSPSDLGSSLVAWYDASNSASIRTGVAGVSQAVSGDPVSEWRDLSGNTFHASQSIAARQPTYNAASWTGSLPTISWNGVDNGLVVTGLTLQKYSMAMVTRHQNVGNVRALITKRAAVSANFFWFIFNTTSGSINWDQSGGRINTGFIPATATDYIYVLVRPLTGSNRQQYVNGTISTNSATNADDNNLETMIIGNDYSAANRGAFSYISELVIVNTNLSSASRESLEGYLAWKWGTVSSLPAGHPYRTAPP